MATAAAASSNSTATSTRPPLAYPSVHLDSFSSLAPGALSFPSPSSPSKSTSTNTTTASPSITGWETRPESVSFPRPQPGPSRVSLARVMDLDDANKHHLHPPTGDSSRLAPIPRPGSAGSFSGSGTGSGSGSGTVPARSPTRIKSASASTSLPPPLPPPTMSLPPLPSPISPNRPPGPYDMDAQGTNYGSGGGGTSMSMSTSNSSSSRPRPLGPSLTIHIPQSNGVQPHSRDMPALKDPPGIPRRRTIFESPKPIAMQVDIGQQTATSEYNGKALSATVAPPPDSPRRLEKKESTMDLKSSPTSPTTRRSLPRPPDTTNNANNPVAPPPSNSWPQPSRPDSLPLASQHQANKSASNLPIVAGLADAGPYPTTPRMSGVAANVGLGRPPDRTPTKAPPEEVCLECMMRDRDLADVHVTGPGAWDRGSDADWDELRWKEETLLKSLGRNSIASMPSLEDPGSSDSESTSASFPSTGNSLEDAEVRRRVVEKKQKRNMAKARRREADERVAREVGWKGFKWEEGRHGCGLPRGFRGTRGGRLTESGIKAVMARFPKSSEHRYEYLHRYLRHQWMAVLEVRAEAQRLGHYPFPGEPTYSDSVSSHEASIVAGPRTSSISWQSGSYTPLPAQPPVRPSPSTPAELGSTRTRAAAQQRPLTHYYSESATPGNVSPAAHSVRSRYEKGISSPGTLEHATRLERWADDEELWSPASGGESSIRPFSFAVRAGAAAGREGSEGGHGRRSLFGRWGGSVTSFFGGSQGGSGSMIDMHLGLDSDRRDRTASNQVHNYPRAVSMASPSRPSFFSRESRASSMDQARDPRQVAKSMSSSRLSQVVRSDADDEGVTPKKKGFKGFLQKMKPKSKRQLRQEPSRSPGELGDVSTPLAPPPNMAYLASDAQRQHSRSGSASSMLTDSQASAMGYRSGGGGGGYGFRSVSAPIGNASTTSLSNSPTSSRYIGTKRESYTSISGRRQSNDCDALGLEKRGSAVEILAAGRGLHTSPEPTSLQDDRGSRPQSRINVNNGTAYPQPHSQPYASLRNSRHTIGSMSNSSGIAPSIETPPMPLNTAPYFSQGPNSPVVQSGSANSLSPNRFKNLPPLPPPGIPPPAPAPGMGMGFDQYGSSPDSGRVKHGYDQQIPMDYSKPRSMMPNSPSSVSFPQPKVSARSSGPGQEAQGYPYPQEYRAPKSMSTYQPSPRGSYDPYGDRGDRPIPRNSYSNSNGNSSPNGHGRAREYVDNRHAHSMYVQPSAAGSTGSFGRFLHLHGNGNMRNQGDSRGYGSGPGQRIGQEGNVVDLGMGTGFPPTPTRDDRSGGRARSSTLSKKGFKGIFGGAKNGRMA